MTEEEGSSLDDVLDAFKCGAHVAHVSALPQIPHERRRSQQRRNRNPERLVHVGPAAVRGELVVPVVDCAVAEQHGETELATRLAHGHPAGRPVDRTDLVTLDMGGSPPGVGQVASCAKNYSLIV